MFDAPDEVQEGILFWVRLPLFGVRIFSGSKGLDKVQHFALPVLGQRVEGLYNFCFCVTHSQGVFTIRS